MSVILTLQNHCGFEVSLVRTVDLKEYPRGMQAWPSRWLRGNGCLLSLMTGVGSSRTLRVEGENCLLQAVLWFPNMCLWHAHACTHWHARTHTWISKYKNPGQNRTPHLIWTSSPTRVLCACVDNKDTCHWMCWVSFIQKNLAFLVFIRALKLRMFTVTLQLAAKTLWNFELCAVGSKGTKEDVPCSHSVTDALWYESTFYPGS